MSRFIFPYGIRFQENGHLEVFPAIEVLVIGNKRRGLRALFHIDSGATTTILPASDAEFLRIDMKLGKKILVRGIFGNPIEGYRHILTIQFNNHRMKIPAIFVEFNSIPRVLGREGIFNYFGILFDEPKHRTLFLDAEEERKTIDSLFE